MLYPQTNHYRTVIDLSGLWELQVDPTEIGIEEGWINGFHSDIYVGVPGSWNEQLSELGLMNYIGTVWYQKRFSIPASWIGQKILLRFGSVDFHAQVWINGTLAGSHSTGYLPFELDITKLIRADEKNLLVVQVNNVLNHDTLPQGVTEEDYAVFDKQRDLTYPPANFDFFPFSGIPRPVTITALPPSHIIDIQTHTSIKEDAGRIGVEVYLSESTDGKRIDASLYAGENKVASEVAQPAKTTFTADLTIPNCHFWSPQSPYLYQLHITLFDENTPVDEYELPVGVREIKVKGSGLYLNGEPVFLQGFGKHEDFPILGKGLSYPLIAKDFQLMKWIGANSFRTSHYPYTDEIMQLADRMGFLVIDEVPAVSLNFRFVTDKTLENHKQALTKLIARDRNHPSVIAWSVGNEAGLWGEAEAIGESAINYWREIFQHARDLDDSRPITFPTCSQTKDKDPAYLFSDFISINQYWGWYEIPTDVDKAVQRLKSDLEKLYSKFKKPILLSEFGADTLEGSHATYPQMFTEEYQSLLIEKYFDVIDALPFVIGEHIWNFADFRTAQHHRRVILNKKGIFNRQREPKSAAFTVRDLWHSRSSTIQETS